MVERIRESAKRGGKIGRLALGEVVPIASHECRQSQAMTIADQKRRSAQAAWATKTAPDLARVWSRILSERVGADCTCGALPTA